MDPNPISCPDVDQNLWRYIDRELSASALAAISSHLRACESCQGLYHERAREASHYRMVFVDSPFGEPFVVKLKRRLRQEAPASPESAAGRKGRGGFLSLRQRKVRRALAVAAMLVLIPVVILIGLLQKNHDRRWLGSFEAIGAGKVSLVSEDGTRDSGVSLPLQARGRYGPGDGIDVPKGVAVLLDHGQSRVTLHGPAFLRVEANSNRDQFLAYLENGKLGAEVTRLNPPQQAFVIRTEYAIASVVGTRFTVEAREEETVLDVQEGRVKFQSASARPGMHEEFVEPGETYRMRKKAQDPEPVSDAASDQASNEPSMEPPSATSPPRSAKETAEPESAVPEAASGDVPAAVESPPPGKGPVKPGDSSPNDLDQPVTR